jgi:DNA-binding SARP family transcriptional activator
MPNFSRKNRPENTITIDVLNGTIRRGEQFVMVTRQQRAIVMALALNRSGLSAERLFDLLYSDRGSSRANAAIRVHVYRLRRRLGLDFIATRDSLYTLGSTVAVSLPDELCVKRSKHNLRALAPDEIESLSAYARTLRSPGAPGLEYYDWYGAALARYRQSGRDLALAIVRELAARGRHLDAIEVAMELVREDSCDEEAWEEVIRSHLSEGRRPAAVRGYQSLCAALKKDLGLRPSSSLVRLLV